MPKRSSKPSKPKLPADVNRRAKAIVDFLTRDRDAEPKPEAAEPAPDQTPGPSPPVSDDALKRAAAELGRRGGLKGGKARVKKMTQEELSQSARNAANARWQKFRDQKYTPEG